MNIGCRLRRIRKSRKLRQEDIANVIGKTQAAYSRIENGKYAPSIEDLIALCRFYHLSADYLIGMTDEM